MPRCKFDAWIARPDSRIAVVGASGWVGAALADQILDMAPGLAAERVKLFTTAPRALTIRNKTLQTQSLTETSRLGDGEWLVLHAGLVGAHRLPSGDLAEARRRNDALLSQVLALAGTGQVRRLVMISSGGAQRPDEGGPAKAAYSRMKRDHEEIVSDWAARHGGAVLLPRVFNLGGPYINAVQYYALGDFILSMARTGSIAIGSGDPVFRDFTHVLELAGMLLHMAVDQSESPEPFDIGGVNVVELGVLAQLVGAAFGQTQAIDRAAPSGGPADRYVADGRRYQAALFGAGQNPILLPQIVADTVDYLRHAGVLSPPS